MKLRTIQVMDVPEGHLKIAQRFNAGMYATPEQVPRGRLKDGADRDPFSRPFGTRSLSTAIPALKRRAIIGMSLRDKLSSSLGTGLALSERPHATPFRSAARL